ncbi:MAG: HAMP domain-containing histidine kinase, partial [Candidatus Aminicenantes bacterium]|nr:HAMP domain-containing histidine kinase [Candidatus Aminicenantes bacterium]
TLKKRKGFFFLLIIAFVIIIIITISLNRVNRSRINNEFKELSIASGEAIKGLIEISGYHLVELGEDALRKFLDRLYTNKSVLYIGLKQNDELVYLLSRYEGYFPVIRSLDQIRFISSPVGMVFEVNGTFKLPSSDEYSLFIGFDYNFLSSFEKSSGKYFLFIIGIILIIMLVIVFIVLRYDKILYQKNLQYIAEIEEKERLKDLSLLTSEIAHEIKNPLNSIYLSFNSLDRYFDTSEDAVFYKGAIKAEIKRISDIINSYSGLSREIVVNYSLIDITEMIDQFRVLKDPEMKQSGVNFKIVSDVDNFVCDRDLLMQILQNLVNNAVEADAGSISVNFSSRKNILTLIVEDDGKGIEPEKIKTIFKPYESSKSKGMGLGLHIVLKNIRAMKGDIEILSGEEGNKKFRVTLTEGKLK